MAALQNLTKDDSVDAGDRQKLTKMLIKAVERQEGQARSEAERKKQSAGASPPVVISAPITKVDANQQTKHYVDSGPVRRPQNVG